MTVFGTLTIIVPKFKSQQNFTPYTNYEWHVPPASPPPIEKPKTPNISVVIPSFLQYEGIVKQIKTWNKEAPELTKIGTYGQTAIKQDLYYIQVSNFKSTTAKPKVLVTACIHGNEPHATSTVMAYIGNLLVNYGKDDKITKLIDERDIYFIPVVSPDSYPHSRAVDGVDPNRDFDNLRSPTVRAIRNFADKEKFKAAWSGHTWGRVFLMPWGDNMDKCPDDAVYREIAGEMASLADYRLIRACEMYNASGLNNPPIRYGSKDWSPHKAMSPIYGAELDWHYRNGAFAVVCEYGTHQHQPSDAETKSEFERTFKAFLCFLEKAPVADLKINIPQDRNLQRQKTILDINDYVNE
jgi:hypothetical protein